MKALYITFLIILLSTSLLAQEGWFWQNPKPQGNDLLDIQSLTNDIGFACGKHGTFLKTTTGGEEWLVLSFPKRIDLLRLHFINPTIGWVTGKKDSIVYLYKTTDAGDTWTKQLDSEAESISSFFIDELLGWLGIDSTLFRTTDGGNTWTQSLILDPITDIFFLDITHGWAACRNWSSSSYYSNIYITTDGGNSWQFSVIEDPIVSKITFENASQGWIISINDLGPNSSGASVWNTIDGGITWQEQLAIGGPSYGYVFTDLDFINENVGWVVTVLGATYKTTNSGTNWVGISSQYLLTQIAPITEQLLWGCGSLGVNYISEDGGLTWVKNFEGEFVYDTWGMFVLNEDFCFAGGENALLKTTNGGDNWEKIELIVPGQSYLNAQAIWFIDTLTGWLGLEFLGGHGGLFKTSDGGYTWTNQVDSIASVFSIYFFNSTLGWFASGSKIYHTSDGGNSWVIQADQSYLAAIYSFQFTSSDNGWAGGYHGLIKTTDGGDTWTQVFPGGINLYTVGIQFLNPIEGWVIGGYGEIYSLKTTDGGINWENQSLPTLSLPQASDIFFTDSEHGWIVGWDWFGDALIIHTTNGGSLWEVMEFPTDHSLRNIGFADENIGWVLGTYGSILHTTNGGVSFLENEIDFTQSKEFLLSQNYPNPFNPVTKIKYSIPSVTLRHAQSDIRVILKVYDILGKEIATLVNEEKPAGEYEVEFNAANLPSGIYFYQLKAGDYIETRKMVLLK